MIPISIRILICFFAFSAFQLKSATTFAAPSDFLKQIQKELNDTGYDAGPVDGVSGPKTTDAIKDYQADWQLEIDGEPSEDLLKRLTGEHPAMKSRMQKAANQDCRVRNSKIQPREFFVHYGPCVNGRPIGIAPILRTSGRFIAPENINRDSISVSMIDSTGKSYSLPFDTHGNFEFVGYPGEWTLQIAEGAENELYKRDIELRNSAVAISTIDLSAQHPDPIRKDPIVVGFDDLTISDALFEIPYGYNGLNWLNWISTHNRFYSGAGYVNATVSSEYIAYNSSGSPALIWSDDAPFDFVGTNIGMAWPRGEEDQVIFRAWRGGEMVYEDRIRPKRTGGLFFAANYLGIDKLEIRSGNYERIALDDFIFRKDSHK